jgi:hypothetical protein
MNINALPMALKVYEEELVTFLQPLITKGFQSIYQDAQKFCVNKEDQVFRKFQYFIKKIRTWSSIIIDEEVKRIKERVPCLESLMAAIFVGKVKILANIRLKGKQANIKIKIPSCSKFIHSIYINVASKIFYDPALFDHRIKSIEKEETIEKVYKIIERSIRETCSQLLPIDQILDEYIGNIFNGEESESEENDSEGNDPEENAEEIPKEINKNVSYREPAQDFGGTVVKNSFVEEGSEEGSEEDAEENAEEDAEDSFVEGSGEDEDDENDSDEEESEDDYEETTERNLFTNPKSFTGVPTQFQGQPPVGQPQLGQSPVGQSAGQPPLTQPPVGQPPVGQSIGQPMGFTGAPMQFQGHSAVKTFPKFNPDKYFPKKTEYSNNSAKFFPSKMG